MLSPIASTLDHGLRVLAAAPPPPEIDTTRRGLALLSILMLLGVLLLVCSAAMLLLNARRRRRRQIKPTPPDFATPDPWKESAARMPPAAYESDIEDDRPHG
ncbi:MAG: hypothetical protein LAT64_01385 [Phycisphaerales bacterium]|nr:hypothetical protein [Planctomycetota bacterium]MCH8507414.1 hypothetical protein [Phycisphaerales bacterium]